MNRTLFGLALIAATLFAPTASAEELSWRATSVQGPRTPGLNTRLGVAVFAHGETATYERRIAPTGPPQDGRLLIQVESVYRFADGSTLVMRGRETIRWSPQGSHASGDTWVGEGEVVAGSGRYAGASGRFSFRAVTGLDTQTDGVLGDSFLAGKADIARNAAP